MMKREDSDHEVLVECTFLGDKYCSHYYGRICCGELLRSCCVNLGIDPDMVDGNLLNVRVLIALRTTGESTSSYELWNYKPSAAIQNYSQSSHPIRIRLELMPTIK
jgi:hypothetical protein